MPRELMRAIYVEDLLREAGTRLGLQPIAGLGGLGRTISSTKIQRPGRELGREVPQIRANAAIVFGKLEGEIVEGLSPSRRRALFRELSLLDLPCIIIEAPASPPPDLRAFAQEHAICLLGTHWSGPRLTRAIHGILHDLLQPGLHLQGVLMQVFGVGVLILGKSGIGKSECALDLISRGHKLVADDLVEIHAEGRRCVLGQSPELIRHHMEVRGLGIINILELFGDEAVASHSSVDLVVELLEWEQFKSMDRTGLTRRVFVLLEADLPMFRIPVSLNRNLAIILEVAVRNYLLQRGGARPLDRLQGKIERRLVSRGSP